MFRETLIDDHHTRGVGGIAIRELASGNYGKAQRREVSRGRHANAGLRHGLAFRDAHAQASTGRVKSEPIVLIGRAVTAATDRIAGTSRSESSTRR